LVGGCVIRYKKKDVRLEAGINILRRPFFVWLEFGGNGEPSLLANLPRQKQWFRVSLSSLDEV
jgi:hypothetical protein